MKFVVRYAPGLALIQEVQRKLPTATFLASANGCIVADSVRFAPGLALNQQGHRKLPKVTFLASANGCTVADIALHRKWSKFIRVVTIVLFNKFSNTSVAQKPSLGPERRPKYPGRIS